jgi:CubicO group peptidase (beta-lactamase class C family)
VDDPVLPHTPFRIGSVTKVFTAAASVAAAQAGQIDLDAPVRELGGPFGGAPERVTLRALLDHRAGIRERMPTPDNAALEGDALVNELVAAFDPAIDGMLYSSAGYALAAATLGRATGVPWLDTVRTRVTDPLGLEVTTTEDSGVVARAACGHLREGWVLRTYDVAEDFAELAHGARWAAPAGGLIASMPDLARFGDALASHASLASMRARIDAAPDGYVLGLQKRTLAGGQPLWHHRGDTGDFVAELQVLPRLGYTVAVAANGPASLRATMLAALGVVGVEGRFDTL